MIIGICGLIGSGKDTMADYLCNFHHFRRESFAGTLKDAVSAVFGWDRMMLEGRTKESRDWRDQSDAWWSNRLGTNITPRQVLQYWGTEVCRRGYHDDIWIASLESKLRNSNDNIVISDCRFPNEIAAIRSQGGMIVCIKRGTPPAWYDLSVQANQGDVSAAAKLAELKVHSSETAWQGTDFDAVIDNNSSVADLYQQISDLLASRLVPKEHQVA